MNQETHTREINTEPKKLMSDYNYANLEGEKSKTKTAFN